MVVLVVSEDAAERRRVVSALDLHPDVEVVEITSGEQARRRIIDRDVEADVLVLDGDLRPRGGFALLYDLKARADLDGTSLAPAIVLTARDEDAFLVDWSRAEAAIRKPVDPFALSRLAGELAAGPAAPEPARPRGARP